MYQIRTNEASQTLASQCADPGSIRAIFVGNKVEVGRISPLSIIILTLLYTYL
jgi:hypothetical protein